MTRQAVIGIDIGTSSSKGVLVGLDGTVLARADRHHDVRRPQPGHVEMDAAIWWDECCAISRALTSHDAEIVGVGVSGMGPCLVVTDAAGEVLRPAILYGIDTRATAQIERLEARLGAEAIVERGHARLTSQAVGPKLAWIADEEPAVFARTRRLFMTSSWLAWKLTGAYVLDHTSASQAWPLYDVAAGAWYAPWADVIAPELEWPTLIWPGDIAGTVTKAAAARTGLPAGIPVVAGTIDAWSESISVGATRPGDLMLMYGTTMFLIAVVEQPIHSPSLWGTIGALPGTFSLAGGMATSGAITSWLRELFGSPDYAELLALADASRPGANGLLLLPYFAGERTPIQDPDARGLIVGLSMDTTRGDLYRAALEATAFGVRHNVDAMRAAGAPIDRIVAVGGGTQGELWTRIVSDVTGLEQVIPRETIGASFGAAFLAASTQVELDIDEWNPPVALRRPDPALAARYDEAYGLYLDLYPATRTVAHALATNQRASVAAAAPRRS